MKILIAINHSYMLWQMRRELVERLLDFGEVVISTPFVGHEHDFEDMGCRCVEAVFDRHGTDPVQELKLLSYYRKLIEKEKPDIVILGGDILDNRLSDENAHLLVEQVCSKYPTYYVSGNHEYWSGRIDEMKDYLKDTGVKVLEGDCDTISFGNSTLDICGIDDPTYLRNDEWEDQIRSAYDKTEDSHVKILVSHRPERVSAYEKYDFDLILTGHAHAGQFRIPFINKGLLAPDQGFMAEYVNGTYELSNGSIMEVSRGLARETTPLPRFFNHPEVVILKLN